MAGDIIYSDDVSSTTNATQAVGLRMHKGLDGVDAVRTSNSIAYVTPTFSGFNARVDYASDKAQADSTVANGDTKLDTLGLSGTYNQGPLLVTAGTHTVKGKLAARAAAQGVYADASGVVVKADSKPSGALATFTAPVTAIDSTNDETKFTVDAVAARYTIGAVKLNAIYAKKKQSYEGVESYKADAMQFGVSYDIGKVTLVGQYGEGSTKFGQATDINGAKVDSKAYQLAAIYNMSKRTNVYAAYGQEDRKMKTVDAAGEAGTVGDKTERSQLAIGLRHSF
jgi:predicted porin